jgi:8-oxo-dGTP diphosphatase
MGMPTKVVAKSFLFDANKQVLVMKRSSTDAVQPGDWDLPGGSVDDNEDFVAAAQRETLEEAGLDIPASHFELCYAATEANEKRSVIRLCFYVKGTSYDDIALSHEHEDYRWVSIDEATELLKNSMWGKALVYLHKHNLLAIEA